MNLRKTLTPAFALLLAAAALAASPATLRADSNEAAKLLPPSTIAFAELKGVDSLIQMVMEHPLKAKIESLDEVQQGYRSKEFQQFKTAVGMFETQLGKPWREAIAELTSGGVYAAFDAETEGAALLIRAANDSAPNRLAETIVNFARANAQGNDQPNPIKKKTYRDLVGYSIDDVKLVPMGAWLLVTNKGDLAKSIADAHLDGRAASLAANERFQQALKARPEASQLWGFLDVQPIRESGEAEEFYREQTDNPGIELLVGGIISTLRETPYATFNVELQPKRLAVAVGTPHDPAWTPEQREFYFGPDGKGRAPQPLHVKNTLFTLTTYRDVGEMWLRAGDLFDENVNDELAKAESNLSTFFSGKDFGEDILAELKPELQLIVAEQSFEGVLPQPSIKLPAFAIVSRLKDPEKMRSELRRTFQSLIGFLNVVGAMQGQPQLDLDMDKDGDKLVVSASYAAEDDEKESTDARINFNFSPSVAFNKDVFVLSSTTGLASELADRAVEQPKFSEDNTHARADIAALRSVLDANREHLIAQNMLEDGNTREEAEKQIGVLLAIMKVFNDATLRLTPTDDSLSLSFEVRLSDKLGD